jgi:hypothetical protein
VELENFKKCCEKNVCLRQTIRSSKCEKEYKQVTCYSKYLKKVEKNKEKTAERIKESYNKEVTIDERWVELRKQCWKRDAGFYDGVFNRKDWMKCCKLWKSLNATERNHIIENYKNEIWLNENIDMAHILPVGSDIEKKYDLENVVLCGRMFHSLLDQHKDPVTRESISKEERIEWFKRAKNFEKEVSYG